MVILEVYPVKRMAYDVVSISNLLIHEKKIIVLLLYYLNNGRLHQNPLQIQSAKQVNDIAWIPHLLVFTF